MERICASGIESAYGRKKVLRQVTVSASAGQCVGIVGANGCGKSTLLGILAGMRKASGGTVFFDGTPARGRQGAALFRRFTGYVPQEGNLIPELSVMDNLCLWHTDKEQLIFELEHGFLHLLGLKEMCPVKVKKLSGGMKKRVSIGCAMAGNPPILLLDEPSAALDLPGRTEVKRYLETYKNAGGAILLATHEESELDVCDKVYALVDGKSREIDRKLRGEALVSEFKKRQNGI